MTSARRLLIPAAALIMAAALLVAALLWRAPVAERSSTSQELSAQAGQVVAQVFTADDGEWKQARDRARTLMTPAFAATAASGLSAEPPAGVTSVKWEPIETGVVQAHREWGTALVVARVTVTPATGEPVVETKAVNVDFVRDGDRWLLDGLDELR